VEHDLLLKMFGSVALVGNE